MADEKTPTEEPKAETPEAPVAAPHAPAPHDVAQAIHEASHAPLPVKPKADPVIVRHVKPNGNHLAGDVAGHPPTEAARLIAVGLAVALK